MPAHAAHAAALPVLAAAPHRIGTVSLVVNDLEAVRRFYEDVVGLRVIERDGATVRLGAGPAVLLELTGDPAARRRSRREAGLFHTAFLLPDRADLGAWIAFAAERRITLQGAADHAVSEAVYLADPEGNGIEIYADRDRSNWNYDRGTLRMGTEALDFGSLMQEVKPGEAGWNGAPDGSVIGHVHLRVGNARDAEQFWNGDMSFDTVVKYGPQAVFLSTGGYHHHIGANSWQSAGAGPRAVDTTGLSFVELAARGPVSAREDVDPWGNVIRTVGA